MRYGVIKLTKSMNKRKNLSWGIIGGGNGGQAIAGYLGSLGLTTQLYDIFPETVQLINEQKGVYLEGAINSFGSVKATLKIDSVITNSDIILVVAPANAHKQIARESIPFLKDGQIIVIVPGSTGGAIEFYNEIKKSSKKNVIVAETQSLFYSCRATKPGHVNIYGVKEELLTAALPSTKTRYVINILKDFFPQVSPAKNVLETSLENINAMLHPLPALLNTPKIENKISFLYYMEGITPSTAKMIEQIDNERINIGKALGLSLHSTNDWLKKFYNTTGKNLYELIVNNKSYLKIEGPQELHNRFFMEDIPMGLIPMVSLAEKLEVPTPNMRAVIQLVKSLVNEDFIDNSRTLENLGIGNLSKDELLELIN